MAQRRHRPNRCLERGPLKGNLVPLDTQEGVAEMESLGFGGRCLRGTKDEEEHILFQIASKFSSGDITPLLSNVQGLPVACRTESKPLILSFKAPHNLA